MQFVKILLILLCVIRRTATLIGEIMTIGLFFQLLICAISLAVYLVAIASNAAATITFAVILVGISVTLISTYMYCYLSERVTTTLEVIGDAFYEFTWYRLPPKQQSLFLLPIQRTQIYFRLTGLGIVDCSLGVFLSVSIVSVLRYREGEKRSFQFMTLFLGFCSVDYSSCLVVFHSLV